MSWRAADNSDGKFFGTGQAFLWRLPPDPDVTTHAMPTTTRLSWISARSLCFQALGGSIDGSIEDGAGERIEQFKWTRASDGQFMRITEDSVAMGGGIADGSSTFGLWLDKTFEGGTSGWCET